MKREYEHELVNNAEGKPIGRVWWNPETEKVQGSNSAVIRLVFSDNHSLAQHPNAPNSDKELIKNLSAAFRSGYISARRVR